MVGIKGLVSVIMPVYNGELYIDKAISSVLKQSYRHVELIIVDDCSTDGTLGIIQSYALDDDRITVLMNKENLGVSLSRNRAVREAKGEWIAFLDSDDCWQLDKLDKQLDVAHTKNAAFIFTGVSYMNEEGVVFDYKHSVPIKVGYRQLLRNNVIACSSVLLKHAFLIEDKMARDDMSEDYALWLTILKKKGIEAYSINEPLLMYRISRNSKSGRKLKAVSMTYQAYRFTGLSALVSMYYTSSHIICSIQKYRRLKIHIF
ncbi:glycosyltransferase [Geomicrobium sp. JCM 19038]|uniref:glycosyltransferase family 2 protein n=1 Tax=Geomicrobium sp. JCM 19038 TaxID=1460635 RepID=UPI00045F2A1F|nr:glycosyltransferase [Geomicrobium sp. JCM 19038]GAK08393.1 putative glycosyltransferase [Geomicrobium sp. JCM 19038]